MGRGFGYGHWIGPALQPSGSFHWMRVGRPESPGFFQYVCQWSAMRSFRPTSIGEPAGALAWSRTSSASTCSVFTVGAASVTLAQSAASAALKCRTMGWVKALHIVFVVSWFAGLFYLPRLFVYHAQ